MLRCLVGCTVLAATISSAVVAQVTARQGAPRFDPAKQFASPMILEVSAKMLRNIPDRGLWTVTGVDEYRCEDAWLAALHFTKRDKGKGPIKLETSGLIMVAESFDRFVTLRFDLLDDNERVLASGTKQKIDAEERKSTNYSFKFEIPENNAEAFRATKAPTLRITMSLLKNGAGYYIPPDETHPR